jgi:hypothetical protein
MAAGHTSGILLRKMSLEDYGFGIEQLWNRCRMGATLLPNLVFREDQATAAV